MSRPLLIHSCHTLFPEGEKEGGVLIEDGKIRAVFAGKRKLEEGWDFLEAGEDYLSPGFIDIHLHGGGGSDFMDGTEKALHKAAVTHLLHGTTSLLPTTLTCPREELENLFSLMRGREPRADEPELLGLHLEGPFLNPEFAGAQDPRFLKEPGEEDIRFLEANAPYIRRITAAPELAGTDRLGQVMKQHGILLSMGHSAADYREACRAMENGYSLLTHFYSGMSSLHREGPYRVLGLVETGYLEDELDIEIIADGIHLPPDLLRLILKQKNHKRICLITDAMRGAGLPDGSIVKLGSLQNGQDVILENGVAMMPDRTAFAGSTATADRCVRTVSRLIGIEESVRMMTENPARILGIRDRKGSLKEGLDADVLVFDRDIQIKTVIVRGNPVKSRG